MAPIQFGILALPYQVVDAVGPTDLLSSASKRALRIIREYVPISEDLISRAPELAFHHIGVTRDPVNLGTSNMTIIPTTTVDECPELDILLVGGPYLGTFDLNPKFAALIRRHVAAGKLVFTTCTGASLVASTGVLDGRKATVNNIEYEWVRKRWPEVHWTREKKWIIDGNIWTGSGAIAATDMVAHWLKENHGLDVLIQAAATLDYEPRDADGLFNVFPQRDPLKFSSLILRLSKHSLLFAFKLWRPAYSTGVLISVPEPQIGQFLNSSKNVRNVTNSYYIAVDAANAKLKRTNADVFYPATTSDLFSLMVRAPNNGRPEAKAGAGVALGSVDAAQFSVPITNAEDNFPVRSNQRAELYAAKLGVEIMAECARLNTNESSSKPNGEPSVSIVATDSEYTVKEITEWLPKWKRNNWRTSKGTEPANLDLFLAIDAELRKHEDRNIKVGFWQIPREHNKLADRLAKLAAIDGDVA